VAHATHAKPKFVTNLYPPLYISPSLSKSPSSTETKLPTTGAGKPPPTVIATLAESAAPRKLPGLPTATQTALPAATATVVVAHWG
jgi:hypothetical protein